eukprot:GHVU01006810.1.p1 GENE.GHVU01006810.1~~GHVU01006810.1.p1  ORF type:complete len:200 (+),score=20.44 GHVU01006810.1:83-601(+)
METDLLDAIEICRRIANCKNEGRKSNVSIDEFLRVSAVLLRGPVRHRATPDWLRGLVEQDRQWRSSVEKAIAPSSSSQGLDLGTLQALKEEEASIPINYSRHPIYSELKNRIKELQAAGGGSSSGGQSGAPKTRLCVGFPMTASGGAASYYEAVFPPSPSGGSSGGGERRPD